MEQQDKLASAIAGNPDPFLTILQRLDGNVTQPGAVTEISRAYDVDIAPADACIVIDMFVRQLRNSSGELGDDELSGVVGGVDVMGFLSKAWESFKTNVWNNPGRKEALDNIKWKINW